MVAKTGASDADLGDFHLRSPGSTRTRILDELPGTGDGDPVAGGDPLDDF